MPFLRREIGPAPLWPGLSCNQSGHAIISSNPVHFPTPLPLPRGVPLSKVSDYDCARPDEERAGSREGWEEKEDSTFSSSIKRIALAARSWVALQG